MKFKNIKVGESYEVKDNLEHWLAYKPGSIVTVHKILNTKVIYVHRENDNRNQIIFAKNLRKLKEKI